MVQTDEEFLDDLRTELTEAATRLLADRPTSAEMVEQLRGTLPDAVLDEIAGWGMRPADTRWALMMACRKVGLDPEAEFDQRGI